MKNKNRKFLVESARITDAYLNMYSNMLNESSRKKYLVAEIGKDGSPVAAKGKNGAYGTSFLEFDSLSEAKKKCIELSSRKGKQYIVSAVSDDGNEKVVYKSKKSDKKLNEDAFTDKAKELEEFNDWASRQPAAKIKTGSNTNSQKIAVQSQQNTRTSPKVNTNGNFTTDRFTDKAKELEGFNDWASRQPAAKIKTDDVTEYPEPETEFTGEELDYLEGKTEKRPTNLPPNARKIYGGYQQSNESYIKVNEAKDIDGKELNVGDVVIIDPVGDFDQDDFVKDTIVSIKGEYARLKNHKGKFWTPDLIKADGIEKCFGESYDDDEWNRNIDDGEARYMSDDDIEGQYSDWWISWVKKDENYGGINISIDIEFPSADGVDFDTSRNLWYRYPKTQVGRHKQYESPIKNPIEMNDVWLPEDIRGDIRDFADYILDTFKDGQEISFESKEEFDSWKNSNVYGDTIGNIDNTNESFEDDEEISNEEILSEYREFLGDRMPIVETKEGEIYFDYDPIRNVFAYGGASNTGLLEDGCIEYDKSESMLKNLENLHDEIYEKYGYPDDSIGESIENKRKIRITYEESKKLCEKIDEDIRRLKRKYNVYDTINFAKADAIDFLRDIANVSIESYYYSPDEIEVMWTIPIGYGEDEWENVKTYDSSISQLVEDIYNK